MNNKGFSLVEILVVVAIMGILSGVAVIGVSRYLTDSKKQAYDNIAESAYDATVNYIMENSIYSNVESISFRDLVDKGYLNEPIDPKTKKADCSCTSDSSCSSYVKFFKSKTDSDALDQYEYEVHINCSSGYETIVTFPKK